MRDPARFLRDDRVDDRVDVLSPPPSFKPHNSFNPTLDAADSNRRKSPSLPRSATLSRLLMRIYLDDCETTLDAKDIASALSAAATVVEKNGRMIVDVHVDGVSWNEEDLAIPEFTARGAGELRLMTAHPAELLRDTMLHAADAVLNAEEIQRNAAKLMQSDRFNDGLTSLLEALAVWGFVQTAVSRGLSLGVVPRERIVAAGIDLDGSVQALDAQLRALREAMISQDRTALSDCLMYEFPATSKRFATMLSSFAKELSTIATSPYAPRA